MEPFIPDALPLTNVDWRRHIKAVGLANNYLARLDTALQVLPNHELLLATILTQEAVLSSKIEGTRATLEDVLENDASIKALPSLALDIEEVDNYRHALGFLVNEMEKKPLSLNHIKEAHRILLQGVRGENKRRGEFRTTQNWIGGIGSPIEEATFIPPSPSILMEHLSALERYFHADDHDALVQLATVHAQFEILHPFLDGNGRMGRILIPLFLYEKKMVSRPYLYISAYFEQHRDEYYHRLQEITLKENWNDWIDFFLRGLIDSARKQGLLASQIFDLTEATKEQLSTKIPEKHLIPFVNFICAHPIFKVAQMREELSMSRSTAHRFLEKALNAGTLVKWSRMRGRGGEVFRFEALLEKVIGQGTLT